MNWRVTVEPSTGVVSVGQGWIFGADAPTLLNPGEIGTATDDSYVVLYDGEVTLETSEPTVADARILGVVRQVGGLWIAENIVSDPVELRSALPFDTWIEGNYIIVKPGVVCMGDWPAELDLGPGWSVDANGNWRTALPSSGTKLVVALFRISADDEGLTWTPALADRQLNWNAPFARVTVADGGGAAVEQLRRGWMGLPAPLDTDGWGQGSGAICYYAPDGCSGNYLTLVNFGNGTGTTYSSSDADNFRVAVRRESDGEPYLYWCVFKDMLEGEADTVAEIVEDRISEIISSIVDRVLDLIEGLYQPRCNQTDHKLYLGKDGNWEEFSGGGDAEDVSWEGPGGIADVAAALDEIFGRLSTIESRIDGLEARINALES